MKGKKAPNHNGLRIRREGGSAVQITNMRACCVCTKDYVVIGHLFICSPDYLVIANAIAEGSLVGPLEQSKVRRIDTEADFVILPRDKVQKVEFLFFKNSH